MKLSPSHPHYHDFDYFATADDYDTSYVDHPNFEFVDDEFVDYLENLQTELLLYVHFVNPDSTTTCVHVYFPYTPERRNAPEILHRLNVIAPVKSIANDCSIDPDMIDCFVTLDELESAIDHATIDEIAADIERKINELDF